MKRQGLVWVGCLLLVLLSGCAGERYWRKGNNAFADGQYEEAVANWQKATEADPEDTKYRSTYLRRRDEILNKLFAEAEALRNQNKFEEAARVYERIRAITPTSQRLTSEIQRMSEQRAFALKLDKIRELQQGNKQQAAALLDLALRDAPNHPELLALRQSLLGLDAGKVESQGLNSLSKKPVTLEFRDANLKMVFEALARNTGINFILDKDIRSDLKTTIFIKKSSLEDAVDLILGTNKLARKVLNGSSVLIYQDTPEKRAEYQDLVVKNFYLTNGDAKRTAEMLKNLLKLKNIHIDEKLNLVMVRDTPEAIALAGRLIANQDLGDPEVMLEVEVLEVKRSTLTNLGIQLPNQLTFTPLTVVNGGNLLVSDLKGLNRSNVTVGDISATINMRSESGDTNILATPRIRARNKEKANILIGDKLPILTTTTTSTGVTSESFQYIEVGLKLEVEPTIYLDNDVGIRVALEVSSQGSAVTSNSGAIAYQIGTRTANTYLRLRDGETQVLAGLINNEERSSGAHLPGVGNIPVLGRLFSNESDDAKKTEIVLSITPHVIRNLRTPLPQDGEVWVGTENNLKLRNTLVPAIETKPAASEEKTNIQVVPVVDAEGAATPPEEPVSDSGEIKAGLSFSDGGKNLKVGESTVLSLNLKSNGGIRSMPLQIGFDPKLVSISNVTEGPYFKKNGPNSVFSSMVNQADGKIYINVASVTQNGASGQDALLQFKVKAEAPGQAELRVLSTRPVAAAGRLLQLNSDAKTVLEIR